MRSASDEPRNHVTRLPSTPLEVARWGDAPTTRSPPGLPGRGGAPQVRDGDRHRRCRVGRVDAGVDDLLPRHHRPLPRPGRARALAGLAALAAGRGAGRAAGRPARLEGRAPDGQRDAGLELPRVPVRRPGLVGRGRRRGVGDRADGLLGLLLADGHADLAARGAGEVVRVPRRAAQRRVRGGRRGRRCRPHHRLDGALLRGRAAERRVVRAVLRTARRRDRRRARARPRPRRSPGGRRRRGAPSSATGATGGWSPATSATR